MGQSLFISGIAVLQPGDDFSRPTGFVPAALAAARAELHKEAFQPEA